MFRGEAQAGSGTVGLELEGGEFFALAEDLGIGHEAAGGEVPGGFEEGGFGFELGEEVGALGFEVEEFEGEFGLFEAFELLAGADAFVFLAGEVLLDLRGVEAGEDVALAYAGAFGGDFGEYGGALEADGDLQHVAGFEFALERDGLADVAALDGNPAGGGIGGAGGGGAGGTAGDGAEQEQGEGGAQAGGGGAVRGPQDHGGSPGGGASRSGGAGTRVPRACRRR